MPEAGGAGRQGARPGGTHANKHTPLHPRAPRHRRRRRIARRRSEPTCFPAHPETGSDPQHRRAGRRTPPLPGCLPAGRVAPPAAAGAALRQPYRGQQRLHLRPLVLGLHAAAGPRRRPPRRPPGRAPREPLGCAGLRARARRRRRRRRRAPSADRVARRQEARASHMAPRTAGPSAGGGRSRIHLRDAAGSCRRPRRGGEGGRTSPLHGCAGEPEPRAPPHGTAPRGRRGSGLRVRRGRRGERGERGQRTPQPTHPPTPGTETPLGSFPLCAGLRPRSPRGCCFGAVWGQDSFRFNSAPHGRWNADPLLRPARLRPSNTGGTFKTEICPTLH